MSSSKTSLIDTKGTLITDDYQSREDESSSSVDCDINRGNMTCNCRRTKPVKHEAEHSAKQLLTSVDSIDDEKSNVGSMRKKDSPCKETAAADDIENTQDYVSTLVKNGFIVYNSKKSEELDVDKDEIQNVRDYMSMLINQGCIATHRSMMSDDLDTVEMSERTERLLGSDNAVYCYCNQRSAYCSKDHNKKESSEGAAHYAKSVDSQSKSSAESLDTTDDDTSSTDSETSCSTFSQTSSSDADVDKCQRCATPVRAMCQNSSRNYYGETATAKATNDSKPTCDREVSAGYANQHKEQHSTGDDRQPDMTYSRTKTTMKDSEMTASPHSHVTPTDKSLLNVRTSNVPGQKRISWRQTDEDSSVSKTGDRDVCHRVTAAEDRVSGAQYCGVALPYVWSTDSCTTETSVSYSCSSCNAKEMDVSDSEHVDDDEIQSASERGSVSNEVSNATFFFRLQAAKSSLFLPREANILS